MKIDTERCRKAMKDITMMGLPSNPKRLQVVEDAISLIQKDGGILLAEKTLATKDYASWSDQRCDCKRGYGPNHGHHVFEIQQKSDMPIILGPDHIYLLECARDFVGMEVIEKNGYQQEKKMVNLFKAIERMDYAKTVLDEIQEAINKIEIVTHEESVK